MPFFDLDGILCTNMLLVFISNLLEEIPLVYIINRWTKTEAKASIYKFDTILANVQNNLIPDVSS